MEEKKKEIRISVRNLVEFILRSGDLDNSSGGFGERDAMQAGTRVHQQIQKKRGADYRAEVPLVHEKEYEHFILRVEGRADGMYEDGTTTVTSKRWKSRFRYIWHRRSATLTSTAFRTAKRRWAC